MVGIPDIYVVYQTARGGHYGNVLQAASGGGLEEIIKLLLEKSARIQVELTSRS
jgi:hypothetical protein